MKDNRKPDPPLKFDWDAGDYRPIPGTEDWYFVTAAGGVRGYNWTTWRAYYSPSARRYFWSDDVNSAEEFGIGSRADALNALRRSAKDHEEYGISPADALQADTKIHTFKEPKP